MRIYSESSEETLRTRRLLANWFGDGLITKAQYERLEPETVSELRTTNVFLRLVLFFFTLIGVGAAVGLFFVGSGPSDQTIGAFLLVFALVCYGAAEFAVAQARLYRYGIEEALAACSVGFLCAGMLLALFTGRPYSPDRAESVVPAAGAVFSLWIWRRFGLWYAFLAVMIFAIFLPGYWTSSHSAQHVIVAAFYATGLICVAALRSGHRFDYAENDYSFAEALLWLGIYLTFNLKLPSLILFAERWGGTWNASQFPRPLYWTTWVLIWCLPPVVLVRGIRRKDRFVISAGAITAMLTLITNKPYLGWPRHTWDPMLLGILLTSVAVGIRRWLAAGPGGIRHGFTAARLSGKDKQWMNIGATVLGPLPQSIAPLPQAGNQDFRFGGGQTGGGGAGGDF